MERTPKNSLNTLFWPIAFIYTLSAFLEALFIHFIMGIALFSSSFYLFLIEGMILYTLSYLLVFRKQIAGTGKPEIPAIILIVFSFFTMVYFMLGLVLIAGIILTGWRDKRAYYEIHPKPSDRTEFSQVIAEGWSRAFRRFRIRKNAHLVATFIVLFMYGIALLFTLGFFTTALQQFFHSFNNGLNAAFFSLIVSLIALPLSLVSLLNPISKVYRFLPGRTGVITKLKGKKGLCIVKVEGFKFRASNPLELEVGTEVMVKKVVVKKSTKTAILNIETDEFGRGNNLAWGIT